ncbi:MAG TPA: TIGR00730 family Rossman fold protein [Candidatus Limnocylindrales bacterium]|nr:TIGR00730 family Rossman fold protein [Candidatus Limnocylindrales bacterium]
MKKTTLPTRPRTSETSVADWERSWQEHWSKVGLPGYELPVGGPGGHERDFLNQTRTPEKESARLTRINAEFKRAFRALYPLGPAVTVFGSARFNQDHRYYQLARRVGAALARAGFATLTGGGPGIMEAANRGAHEAGGRSVGLNIILPHEQCANPYVDQTIEFHYFFTRKVCLVKYSCAFIVMPGGLGTLDELFEAATLIQCKKIGPFPLVLIGSKFWKGLQDWGQFMMEQDVFTKDEIGFGRITDDPEMAVGLIRRGLPPALNRCLRPLATVT